MLSLADRPRRDGLPALTVVVFALAVSLAADVSGAHAPVGVHLGIGLGAGVVGGDVAALVDVSAGIETTPFSLHLRAPITLRLVDLPPTLAPSLPSSCQYVRCEEFLTGQRLDPTAVARLVDEVRVFRPGDEFHARAGRLAATLGAGASVDRFTTMASWDRRTSGAFASLRQPGFGTDVVIGDVISPLELLAARAEWVPFGLPFVVGVEGASDLFAPDDVVAEDGADVAEDGADVDDGGAIQPGATTRPLAHGAVDVRVPFAVGPVSVAPRLEASVTTGLTADGGAVDAGTLSVGGGGGAGLDASFKVAFLELRGIGIVSASSLGDRRGVFSTFHLVERRRALVGSVVDGGGVVHVPAPGGVGLDLRVDASILDAVAPLARLHLEPAPGGNAVELGVVVDLDPVQVSVSATRRGFVDVVGIVDAELQARPLLLVAEAGWRVWGPVSVQARWYRLPRFRDGDLVVDDDVIVGLSVNGAFQPR